MSSPRAHRITVWGSISTFAGRLRAPQLGGGAFPLGPKDGEKAPSPSPRRGGGVGTIYRT